MEVAETRKNGSLGQRPANHPARLGRARALAWGARPAQQRSPVAVPARRSTPDGRGVVAPRPRTSSPRQRKSSPRTAFPFSRPARPSPPAPRSARSARAVSLPCGARSRPRLARGAAGYAPVVCPGQAASHGEGHGRVALGLCRSTPSRTAPVGRREGGMLPPRATPCARDRPQDSPVPVCKRRRRPMRARSLRPRCARTPRTVASGHACATGRAARWPEPAAARAPASSTHDPARLPRRPSTAPPSAAAGFIRQHLPGHEWRNWQTHRV